MKKTRVVLLGTGAFPPILRLWLETVKIWQNEVDKIYIAVDEANKVSDELKKFCKKFPKIVIIEGCRGWPNSYNDAYEASKEDLFLIMHDDTLVYEKGLLDRYFRIAEKGKVAVPMHQIYEPAHIVNAALLKKYGWDNPPYSFLLYFLFISRKNLKKTTINFNGIGWLKDEAIPLLGIESAPEGIAGDTGFLLGLELFEKQVPIYPILNREGWLHIQNVGNTIPLWFKEDLDSREWNLKYEEARLTWLYLMLKLLGKDNYWEIFKKVREKCNADYGKIVKMANILNNKLFGRDLK